MKSKLLLGLTATAMLTLAGCNPTNTSSETADQSSTADTDSLTDSTDSSVTTPVTTPDTSSSTTLPDEDHYTTPYDLYLIMNEAMKYDEFREIASTPSYTATFEDAEGNPKTESWQNGNGFLAGKFSLPAGLHVSGSKTGHTNAAGFCLVMGERSDSGDNYISVTMKAPSYDSLYNGTACLLQKINK